MTSIIHAVPATSQCPITAGYHDVLRATLATPKRAMLFNYTIEGLESRRATVVALEGPEKAIRGGFFHVAHEPGYYFGGVVSDPARRDAGKMTRMIALTMRDLAIDMEDVHFSLDVRVLNGVPNVPAFRLFTRLGFRPDGPFQKVWITGTTLDRHLLETREPHGPYFYAQKMLAGARALKHVEQVLKETEVPS
jgi:hypothetical protein